MALVTRPLSAVVGVEVIGLDASRPFDDRTVKELRDLYRRHRLLLLRGQEVEEDDQLRFSEVFGPVSRRAPAMRTAKTAYVSNGRKDGILGDGELFFHSDNTFFRDPLKAIVLYAIEVPPVGGDTLFADCAAAYAGLDDATKARLEGLTTYQLFDYGSPDYSLRSREEGSPEDAPRAVHPVVWRDPDSGTPVLFLSEHTTVRINELPRAEGEALIAELRAAIADPAIGYRHRWRAGDLLVWDNVMLQHAREPFDATQRRTLRRVPIGDPEGERRFPDSFAVEGRLPPQPIYQEGRA